jgi:hypothetical protein
MAKSLYCPQCNEEYWGTQQSLADHPVCGGCGYDKLGKPDPTVFDLVTDPSMRYLWKITYPDSEVEYMVTKDRVTMMEETKRLNNVHKPDEVKVEVLDFARVLDIDREYLTAVVED